MKIAILGAGVIGVTTAIELNRDGHNVIVIDRQPDVGLETSFANAGLIAPGHSYAWETKGMPKDLRIWVEVVQDLVMGSSFAG